MAYRNLGLRSRLSRHISSCWLPPLLFGLSSLEAFWSRYSRTLWIVDACSQIHSVLLNLAGTRALTKSKSNLSCILFPGLAKVRGHDFHLRNWAYIFHSDLDCSCRPPCLAGQYVASSFERHLWHARLCGHWYLYWRSCIWNLCRLPKVCLEKGEGPQAAQWKVHLFRALEH